MSVPAVTGPAEYIAAVIHEQEPAVNMNLWFLIPFAVLAIWAWVTTRTLRRIRDRIEEAESGLAHRLYRMHARLTEMEAAVRELEFERRRLRGEVRFGPGTRLAEALDVHPRVREILAMFGVVGSEGAPPGTSTLEEACRERNADLRALLRELDRFLGEPGAPPRARAPADKVHPIPPPR